MFDPRILGQMGRRGDTMVAHISPQEAAILKYLGGSGTMNPETGLPEFYSSGSADSDADADAAAEAAAAGMGGFGGGGGWGSGYTGGPAPGGPDPNAEGSEAESMAEAERAASRANEGFSMRQAEIAADVGNRMGPGETLLSDPFSPSKQETFFESFSKKATPSYSTALGLLGMLSPIPGGFFLGRGLGGLLDKGYEFSAPTDIEMARVSPEERNQQGDYTQLAQNMISGPTGVSQAQQVSQPESAPSFDRQAFGQFGTGLIGSQAKSQKSSATSGAADRGMGTGSGQLAGQLAIQNQQSREKMNQWAQMMSDPNMGYQDLSASLMNILV